MRDDQPNWLLSQARYAIYVHAMFVDDPETIRGDIKMGMERRVLEALR